MNNFKSLDFAELKLDREGVALTVFTGGVVVSSSLIEATITDDGDLSWLDVNFFRHLIDNLPDGVHVEELVFTGSLAASCNALNITEITKNAFDGAGIHACLASPFTTNSFKIAKRIDRDFFDTDTPDLVVAAGLALRGIL